MKTEIKKKLEELANKRTIPFCYSCYEEAASGTCKSCGSDDLMRLLPGVGVEYGDWAVEHILREALTPVDVDQAFEDFMREAYSETITIGYLQNFDTVTALKELDPVAWDMAKSEWIDSEESDERIMSFDNGSTYYWVGDLEGLE